MEDEFLLAVSNDTLIFNDLINDFIEKFKNLKIYTEEEINEEIQIKKLIGIIDKLNNNAVIHLVYEHKDLLENEIEKEKYLKIDLINIIKKSAEIYAKYKSMMNNRVIKIFYNEILKITLCYYITKIVLIPNKKKVKKEDIISKIKKDKETFFNAFSDLIGQNLTNSTLILLDYIINLLEIDKNKITSPILTIRQYIGPAFTYSVAKELIKLRSDLKKEEIINCKTLCEEVLNGYESPKEESSSSYFQMLSSKVKKNEKDKEYEQIRASQLKFGEDLIKDKEKGKNELIFYDNKINEINNNSYNDSDMEDEIRSSIAINMTNERNFIRTSMIDLMKDNDNNNDDLDKNIDKIEEEDDEENEIKEDIEEENKPDYEGIIYKKRKSSFIKYYYQIKNCSLYWFENQTSIKPENKISLENITIINPKEDQNKFSIKSHYKGGEQEDQFKCNSLQEKNALINAISNVRNDSKKINNLVIKFEKIEIKKRKKIIKDHLKTNKKLERVNIEKNIFEYLKTGKYFNIDKNKFEKEFKKNSGKENKTYKLERK